MLRLALSREMKQHLVDAGIATAKAVDDNVAAMARNDDDGLFSAAMSVQITARKPDCWPI